MLVLEETLLGLVVADGCGFWKVGGGRVASVQGSWREPGDATGPGQVEQWRLPLTGSVSYPPARHGRASQTAAAAALKLQTKKKTV